MKDVELMAGRNGTAAATTLVRILAPAPGCWSTIAKAQGVFMGCWAHPLEHAGVPCLQTAEEGLV